MKTCISFCLIIIASLVVSQEVIINEFMSSNSQFIFDEDNDDHDWIEIFNASSDTIQLANYCISDNTNNLTKWCFPDTTIRPNEFMLIFASDKNRATTGHELHTNFKISAAGEDLILSKNGLPLQHISPVELMTNTSYGAYPDGTFEYSVFTEPTPGLPNYINPEEDLITFSKRGGIYNSIFTLTLTSLSENRIFYTIDGSIPDTTSLLYETPLTLSYELCSPKNISLLQISPDQYYYPPDTNNITKNITIKAASFDSLGNRVSSVETHSYFINELNIQHHLPVMSITAEYDDLFDAENGLFVPGIHFDSTNPNWTGNYYMRGIEWEKEIFVEFYEPNNTVGFRQHAGLRTHGGNSRRFPQKGLRLYARSEYGLTYFNYNIFSDRETEKYKRLVLRPFESSWTNAGIEDYIAHESIRKLNVDRLASRLVVLYINGEYWGIYILQERIDQYYISTYYDINPDSIDLISNWFGHNELGSPDDFLDLYEFVRNNDLSLEKNYEIIQNRIDINNFIDYQLFQIFIINYDWPTNNMKCWRSQQDESKWRWIFFDGDAGFFKPEYPAFEHAMSEAEQDWPTNSMATLFFRKLLENQEFYEKFFQRFEHLLNTELAYSTLKPIYSSIFWQLEPEIPLQVTRFASPQNDSLWYYSMSNISNFLFLRQCIIAERVFDLFGVELYIPFCNDLAISNIIRDITIYPNPNHGTFSMSFNASHTGMADLFIVNSLGQTVVSQKKQIVSEENRIDFKNMNLPKGLYVIAIISQKEVFSTKLLITD